MADELSSHFRANIEVPFPTVREAEIAYNTLSVDEEPKRSAVHRELSTSENILKVNFTAQEAKHLRVACNSFLDHLILVMNTIDEFGPARQS